MSETFQIVVLLLAAVPTTIAAVTTMILAIINARRSKLIISKAEEIHQLTNSTLSKLNQELTDTRAERDSLRILISTLDGRVAAMIEARIVAERAAQELKEANLKKVVLGTT